MEMNDKAFEDLRNYLIAHEEDICLGIDDFGELEYLFMKIFDRAPADSLYQ